MSAEPQKKIESQSPEDKKMSASKKIAIAVIAVAVGWMLLQSYLFKPAMYNTRGDTMGTQYHVIVCADSAWGWERTAMAIENELVRVNQMMSTFIADSEISQFNDNSSVDWVSVSPEMVQLVKLSKEVSQTVDGKFDITVGPLVDLWGFGKKKKTRTSPPAPTDIAMAQSISGIEKLEYQENPPALKKAIPELRIDLSGIAKGYGVDCIAAVLEKRGYSNYMIEIGGETRTRGHKIVQQEKSGWLSFFSSETKNSPWSIGVKQPIAEGMFEQPIITLKVNLNDHAMATSGDVYNYQEIGGQRYTHIIDPVTGNALQPSEHGTGIDGEEIGSVSVVAETCAKADALATGFFLLGVERGIATADANNLPIVYLIRTGESDVPIRAIMSEAYKKNYAQE